MFSGVFLSSKATELLRNVTSGSFLEADQLREMYVLCVYVCFRCWDMQNY